MRRKKTVMEKLEEEAWCDDCNFGLEENRIYFVSLKTAKRLLREVAKEAYIYGHADGGLNIIKSYELKKALKEVLGK